MPIRVLIRGAGDLATGVAVRLFNSGFQIVMTELPQPQVVRRGAAFAEAVFEGTCEVEGIRAKFSKVVDVQSILEDNKIPVLIDENNQTKNIINPDVVVDARMLKLTPPVEEYGSIFVVGLGPGFSVNLNCDVIIETKRGHNLGKVIWQGQAMANTSIPGKIGGKGAERVLRAPTDGQFVGNMNIGNLVIKGDKIATVSDKRIVAPFDGVIRGLLASGIMVYENMKIGDVDPRGNVESCFTVSDKARSIGGSVLEAILSNKSLRAKYSQL
jgi:xanthine dehydrogenase accessory factor